MSSSEAAVLDDYLANASTIITMMQKHGVPMADIAHVVGGTQAAERLLAKVSKGKK